MTRRLSAALIFHGRGLYEPVRYACTRAAGDRDVRAAGRDPRLLEGGLDAVGDERKRRAACVSRGSRGSWVSTETGAWVGPVLAPPAAPWGVPWTAAAAEHPAPHDVRADALAHLLDDLGVEVVEALVGARDEAVERDRDVTATLAHGHQ